MKRMIVNLVQCLAIGAALSGMVRVVPAHELTSSECREGGDFIKHAAMSRDYGVSREMFLDRMQSDLAMIQAFPPHLRWFVQDPDDEELLSGAARLVFDAPRAPESHQSAFLEACLARVSDGPERAGTPSSAADAQ